MGSDALVAASIAEGVGPVSVLGAVVHDPALHAVPRIGASEQEDGAYFRRSTSLAPHPVHGQAAVLRPKSAGAQPPLFEQARQARRRVAGHSGGLSIN